MRGRAEKIKLRERVNKFLCHSGFWNDRLPRDSAGFLRIRDLRKMCKAFEIILGDQTRQGATMQGIPVADMPIKPEASYEEWKQTLKPRVMIPQRFYVGNDKDPLQDF